MLRQHLSLIAANGYNPLKRLTAVVRAGDFDDAADPAAVIDWRLDPSGSHSGGTGPLPWLPAIPSRLRDDPHWGTYLSRRAELIRDLDTAVRADSRGMDDGHRTPLGATHRRHRRHAGRRSGRLPGRHRRR